MDRMHSLWKLVCLVTCMSCFYCMIHAGLVLPENSRIWQPLPVPVLLPVHAPRIVYGRDTLLDLQWSHASNTKPTDYEIPAAMKRRKRGRKGGVRERNKRRKFKPALPSIIMGNTQSLRNKLDELKSCSILRREYWDSCLMCFSETWFKPGIDTQQFSHIDGFTCIRGDRTIDSGKSCGGGVCVYVNDRWCSNVSIKQQQCSSDLELLTVALRPFYLPREFPQLLVTVVYISPSANVALAANKIHDVI